MRQWMALVVLLLAGCAPRQTRVPPEAAVPAENSVLADRRLDAAGLDIARGALEDGSPWTAVIRADSLFEAWLGNPAVRRDEARELSELLEDLNSEDRAARFLVHTPLDVVDRESSRLRKLCESLVIPELRDLLEETPAEGLARVIVRAELSRALALAGHLTEALDMARAALDGGAAGDDQRKAEDVLEGRVAPLTEPVRIGLVLPGTGRFAAVGEQILEGALLELERVRAAAPEKRLEIVVLDDSSSVEAGIRRVEELERLGVVAVVGPIRSEALVASAVERRSDDLTLISPTASAGPRSTLDAYTIWDMRRRTTEPAVVVATWMVREMGLDNLGVLYPDNSDSLVVAEIREAVAEQGGTVVAAAPYPPDSTTFVTPISVLAEREPAGVVVVSDGPRTVLQVAPQIVYYGLRRWVVGGDANWSDPAVIRRLEPSYSDFRLVGTYLDRLSPGTEWKAFEQAYEARYRKSLPDNMFSALGYDAMKLVLMGVPVAGAERRGGIGRAIRRTQGLEGATGRLHVDTTGGTLVRDVFVRVIRSGRLEVPDPAEMIEWANGQRQLEDFLRELEACKEEDAQVECPPTTEDGR